MCRVTHHPRTTNVLCGTLIWMLSWDKFSKHQLTLLRHVALVPSMIDKFLWTDFVEFATLYTVLNLILKKLRMNLLSGSNSAWSCREIIAQQRHWKLSISYRQTTQHQDPFCPSACFYMHHRVDPSAAAVSRRAEFFYHQPKISRIYLRLAVSRRKKIHGSAAVKCSASRLAAKAPQLLTRRRRRQAHASQVCLWHGIWWDTKFTEVSE